MFYLASRGYCCIAHDRRGHGRSSQPWSGNDMDTYADDLVPLGTPHDQINGSAPAIAGGKPELLEVPLIPVA